MAERLQIDQSVLRFIFHGRVLNDADKLSDRGISDGMTVLAVTGRPPGVYVI